MTDLELQTVSRRKEIALLCLLVLIAFSIRLYFLQFYLVISADGVGYVSAARDFLIGKGFHSSLVYGTVYPALTAAFSFVTGGDFELAGRLVSSFMGSLLPVPVYLLGRELFSRRAGAIAALLVLVWPTIRSWSCEIMTQATYMTLALSGIYLFWRAARKGCARTGVAAGAVLALSYLTRPEGFILFAALAAALFLHALILKQQPAEILRRQGPAWGGFLLLFVPYFLFIHASTGHWQLTGKMGMTLADALSGYLGRPDLKLDPEFHGIGIVEVLRQYPDFVWQNSRHNLALAFQTMLPLYLWIPALIGLVWSGWDRERVGARLFLLASFAPLGIVVAFFFVGPEYVQPYLPVLFLFAGHGACRLETFLFRRSASPPQVAGVSQVAGLGLLLTLGLACFLVYQQVPANRNKPYELADDDGRYDQKRLGLLLKRELPRGSKIMTRWGRISYYAELERLDLPQTELNGILDAARRGGARFLVVDGSMAVLRPQLGSLLQPLYYDGEVLALAKNGGPAFEPIAGVRLYLLYKKSNSNGMAVYELL